jgi:hypothetical protein
MPLTTAVERKSELIAAQYRTELIDSAQAHGENTPLSALARNRPLAKTPTNFRD